MTAAATRWQGASGTARDLGARQITSIYITFCVQLNPLLASRIAVHGY
jgi:hypothetical protein